MTDRIAKEMGLRLKRSREEHNLTQQELANKAHVRQSAIANFESGSRRIRREIALEFERILGRPAGYFLCILSEEEAGIIQALRTHRSHRT